MCIRDRFNHLGIFRYSDEEGTPAFKLKDKVSSEDIEKRFDQLHDIQKEIARENNQKYLGKTINVLIEGEHSETELLIQGRHEGQAPDIDGKVIINELNVKLLKVGELVQVKINDVLDYD